MFKEIITSTGYNYVININHVLYIDEVCEGLWRLTMITGYELLIDEETKNSFLKNNN